MYRWVWMGCALNVAEKKVYCVFCMCVVYLGICVHMLIPVTYMIYIFI